MNILKIKKLSKMVMHYMHAIINKDIFYSKNLLTITKVEISKNLSTIHIYMLIRNDNDKKIIKYLNSKKKYFRHLLIKKIHFNVAPEIFFCLDAGFLVSLKINNSIDEILNVE